MYCRTGKQRTSKKCCVFQKKRAFDESDSEESDSDCDSDIDVEKDLVRPGEKRQKGWRKRKQCDPNCPDPNCLQRSPAEVEEQDLVQALLSEYAAGE